MAPKLYLIVSAHLGWPASIEILSNLFSLLKYKNLIVVVYLFAHCDTGPWGGVGIQSLSNSGEFSSI